MAFPWVSLWHSSNRFLSLTFWEMQVRVSSERSSGVCRLHFRKTTPGPCRWLWTLCAFKALGAFHICDQGGLSEVGNRWLSFFHRPWTTSRTLATTRFHGSKFWMLHPVCARGCIFWAGTSTHFLSNTIIWLNHRYCSGVSGLCRCMVRSIYIFFWCVHWVWITYFPQLLLTSACCQLILCLFCIFLWFLGKRRQHNTNKIISNDLNNQWPKGIGGN